MVSSSISESISADSCPTSFLAASKATSNRSDSTTQKCPPTYGSGGQERGPTDESVNLADRNGSITRSRSSSLGVVFRTSVTIARNARMVIPLAT